MSKSAQFHRHARMRTDRAISRAIRAFRADMSLAIDFDDLVVTVRSRSSILDRPLGRGPAHPQVEVLCNLARHHALWCRPLDTWSGHHGAIYPALRSLVHHLCARYELPPFLSSVWFGGSDAERDRQRSWFIAHGSGKRFRDLDLPMRMTRRMEDVFLRSSDHWEIIPAMRRAELVALGASEALVDAVLATRLREDLSNGDFWRSVMIFLVRCQADLDLARVGPIVDFLQFVRHEAVEVAGANGAVRLMAVQPEFSMKGRTLRSLLHLVEEWHCTLSRPCSVDLRWSRSGHTHARYLDERFEPDQSPVFWELHELTSSSALAAEGAALRHCVGSYTGCCLRGESSIWSLRRKSERAFRSILTIEIDPARRAIVQVRGFRNKRASGQPLRIVERWAREENLDLAL